MDFLDITLYFGVAFVAGGINAVAGGGTFLTFPFLVLHGQTPLQANITSTIALWPGAVSSAYAYRSQINIERKLLIKFMLASAGGCAVGTALLLLLPEVAFTHAVPWLMLFATLVFTFGARIIRVFNHLSKKTSYHPSIGIAMQGAIGIYGGYFGAGQGMLMLAMLQLMGMHDIHRMNGLKSLLGASINALAVVIFIVSGKVLWVSALIMMAGGITGGFVGARTAMRIAPKHVRRFVSATGAVMTIYFFTQ